MVTDAQGNTIVSGVIARRAYEQPNTPTPGFITKVDASGRVVFSRDLPASLRSIAVDPSGDVYVTGRTSAADFPITKHLTTEAPGARIFVMKLSGADGSIIYSTSLGNSGVAGVSTAITVDAAGRAFVAGSTDEAGIVVTPGAYTFDWNVGSTSPTFFAALSPAGDAVFAGRFGGNVRSCAGSGCSILGASYYASPNTIALDVDGNFYIAGATNLRDLPVTADAFQKTCGCGNFTGDGFLAKFSADGRRLLYASYLGDPSGGADYLGNDSINSLAFDPRGNVWVAGTTTGTRFPVSADALHRENPGGGLNGFLTEFSPAGALLFSTYLGSSAYSPSHLAVADGRLLLTGETFLTTWPDAFDGFPRGPGFLAVFDPAAHAFVDGSRFARGVAGTDLSVLPDGSIQLAGTAWVPLPPWNFGSTVTSNTLTRVQLTASTAPNLGAVANAAGYAAAARVAAGEIIALYGARLGLDTGVGATFEGGRAPLSLAGVQVLVDGMPVPLLYLHAEQINAIVPFSVAGKANVRLMIRNANGDSAEAILPVVGAVPEVFTTWTGLRASALNEDQSVNGPDPSQRAKPGTLVSIFTTGAGDLTPRPEDGQVSTDITAHHVLPVQVLYQGTPLEITYAGPAPTLVAGVTQVNFRLPAQVSGATEPQFTLKVGDWESGPFVVLVKE